MIAIKIKDKNRLFWNLLFASLSLLCIIAGGVFLENVMLKSLGFVSEDSYVDISAVSTNLGIYEINTDIKIGTAVRAENIESNIYESMLNKNFNLIVPEYEMKWSQTQPGLDNFNFVKTDEIVNYAVKNNKTIHGHTLIWYNNVPSWVEPYLNSFPEEKRPTVLTDILKKYISTVVGRYKGKIASWDVVNEVIANRNEEATDYGGFRKDSLFEQYLPDNNGNGIPDYIELAFQFAYEADTDAKLFYNDYNIEYINPSEIYSPKDKKFTELKTKSENAFNFVATMLKNNIPISGVGIQGHITDTKVVSKNFTMKKQFTHRPKSIIVHTQFSFISGASLVLHFWAVGLKLNLLFLQIM